VENDPVDVAAGETEPGGRPAPPYLAWGKTLPVRVDFIVLVLVVWRFARWAGGEWFSSPAFWLTVAGGVIFLVGENLAVHYWALAGRWSDRAYALLPGPEKERAIRQRDQAERLLRRSVGVGGVALPLLVGPIYLPG
jgi:hypothetical protein